MCEPAHSVARGADGQRVTQMQKSPRARGAQREGEQQVNFSTITEIPGRGSDFDQKLILAARGQLNGGDGMRGRRDLGGPWPKCPNAPHSKTYMAAQRVVWTLQ